ncbi:unnamed protein product [Closterium sp. NIES-64]|nr:unnamed protein product [Closterium sp. NIES-64]
MPPSPCPHLYAFISMPISMPISMLISMPISMPISMLISMPISMLISMPISMLISMPISMPISPLLPPPLRRASPHHPPYQGAKGAGGEGEQEGSGGEVVSAPRADAEQVATATTLMRYMHLKDFSPLNILNPVIQTHYSMLEAIALDLPEVQPVVDTTLPDYNIFLPPLSDTNQPRKKGKAVRATAALRHFKDAVYGPGHDEEEAQRTATARAKADAAEKKRKATYDAATAKAGVVDWRGLAEKGKGGKPLPPASQCFPWRPHHFSARLTPHGASSPGGSSAVPHARGNTPTTSGVIKEPAGNTITDTSAVRADLSKRLEACRTQQASQGSTDTRALVSGAGKGREEAGGADNPEAQARAVQAEGMSGKPEDLAQRARLAEAQVDMAELQAQVVCAELQWIRSAVERQEAGVAAVLAELAGLRQRVHRARRCAEGGDGGDGAQESGEGKMREVQQVEAAVASAEARLWRVEAAAADARASLIALGGEAGGLGGLGGLAGIGAGEGGNVGGLCGECWCESGLGNRPVEGGIGVGCGGEVCGGMRGCAVLEGYGVGEVGLSAAEFALELQRRLEEVQKELVAKGQGHRVVQEKERRGVVEGPAGGVEGAGVSPSVEGKGEQPMVEGTERVKGAGQASGGEQMKFGKLTDDSHAFIILTLTHQRIQYRSF